MPSTMNLTRASRRQNEEGIAGAEAVTVENVGIPDQVISAATEEQTAMGAFKDHQLQTLALLADQDVKAQFLGVRYPITDLLLNAAASDSITHAGDLTNMFRPGDVVRIEGTVADDGIYLLAVVVAGELTLEDQTWPVGAGGAVGTFARVCSMQFLSYVYAIATAAVTGVITVAGDVSDKFIAGGKVIIETSTGNDGIWDVDTVTTDGPPVTTTTLTLNGGSLPDATNDGSIEVVRDAIALTANVPYLWSVESGMYNPFFGPFLLQTLMPVFNVDRGDVSHCMVNNAGATNANFDGRIGTDADLT